VSLKVRWKYFWEESKLHIRLFWAALKAFAGVNDNITPVGRLDSGVAYIVDAFQNTVELENMKYHGSGTGTTAEAQTQTALVTEVETRATGTTEEGASANIYKTVGTVSYTGANAITEHGVFSAINVGNGDSIQFTYELTFPAGS